MNKREYCENRETIAYYSGKTFHRAKICYPSNGAPFFRVHGRKVSFGECVRMGL